MKVKNHRKNCTIFFFWAEPVAFRRVYGTWDLLVYHVTIAVPYPGGIGPRLAGYARSWDGHYTTTRRDRLGKTARNAKKQTKTNHESSLCVEFTTLEVKSVRHVDTNIARSFFGPSGVERSVEEVLWNRTTLYRTFVIIYFVLECEELWLYTFGWEPRVFENFWK